MSRRTKNTIGLILIIIGSLMMGIGILCAYLYIFDGYTTDEDRAGALACMSMVGMFITAAGAMIVSN